MCFAVIRSLISLPTGPSGQIMFMSGPKRKFSPQLSPTCEHTERELTFHQTVVPLHFIDIIIIAVAFDYHHLSAKRVALSPARR